MADQGCKEPSRLFPVLVGNKWGFIDVSGRVVVQPLFESIAPFSEGLARVYFNGRLAFVSSSGKTVLERTASEAQDFSEGLAGVKVGPKWGFIDKSGTMIIDPRFDSVTPFSEGTSAVRVDSEWEYIDRSGKVALMPRANGWDRSYASPFHEGLALLFSKNGKTGYMGRGGDWIVKPTFDSGQDFEDSFAAVETDGKWGYIGKDGSLRIAVKFANASSFHDGLAAVRVEESPAVSPLAGFVDTSGISRIPPQFDDTRDFCEGMAAVNMRGEWGYVNRAGTLVIRQQFKHAGSFSGGLALVVVEDASQQYHTAYIDKSGTRIWTSAAPVPLVD
ncbi:MAG: WG repeat-containing protein [Terriglobales bacterium]